MASNHSFQYETQITTLANGDRVPLSDAIRTIVHLRCFLDGHHDLEWEPLPLLRELAFGNTIAPEQIRMLQKEMLLDEHGKLDPVMRSVILSAVRGEGKNLRLESPFTNQVHRTVADLVHAKDFLNSTLKPIELATIHGLDDLIHGAVSEVIRTTPVSKELLNRDMAAECLAEIERRKKQEEETRRRSTPKQFTQEEEERRKKRPGNDEPTPPHS